MPPLGADAAPRCRCRPSVPMPPPGADAAPRCRCRPSVPMPPLGADAAPRCRCRRSVPMPPLVHASRHLRPDSLVYLMRAALSAFAPCAVATPCATIRPSTTIHYVILPTRQLLSRFRGVPSRATVRRLAKKEAPPESAVPPLVAPGDPLAACIVYLQYLPYRQLMSSHYHVSRHLQAAHPDRARPQGIPHLGLSLPFRNIVSVFFPRGTESNVFLQTTYRLRPCQKKHRHSADGVHAPLTSRQAHLLTARLGGTARFEPSPRENPHPPENPHPRENPHPQENPRPRENPRLQDPLAFDVPQTGGEECGAEGAQD